MLKIIEKMHNPISTALSRRITHFKNEDLSYVTAFSTSLRQKLIPYHSRSLKNYPDKNEMDSIYKQIYNEINELYTDEHETIAKNDFLEQCYDLFSNIHQLVRKYELVYDLKLEENRKKFYKNDPNSFPVYNLSYSGNDVEWKTIWDILGNEFKDEFLEMSGFYLDLKKSKIDHPEAENGIFLNCPNRKFILPGTILGFYPGMIHLKNVGPPKITLNTSLPYLKRPDGNWVDPSRRVPYPLPNGIPLVKWLEIEEDAMELRGLKDHKYNNIPLSYRNPLSVGDKINHPPPDTPANVKFIDLDIPYHFFPNEFYRYVPNVCESEDTKNYKFRFTTSPVKTVCLMSTAEISHGEELFVDYIEEGMIPSSFRPDWLLQPPPRNPYLIKKEYVHKLNYLDNLAIKMYFKTYNKEHLEFRQFIEREQGLDLIRSNANIKILQNEFKVSKKLEAGKEANYLSGEDKKQNML